MDLWKTYKSPRPNYPYLSDDGSPRPEPLFPRPFITSTRARVEPDPRYTPLKVQASLGYKFETVKWSRKDLGTDRNTTGRLLHKKLTDRKRAPYAKNKSYIGRIFEVRAHKSSSPVDPFNPYEVTFVVEEKTDRTEDVPSLIELLENESGPRKAAVNLSRAESADTFRPPWPDATPSCPSVSTHTRVNVESDRPPANARPQLSTRRAKKRPANKHINGSADEPRENERLDVREPRVITGQCASVKQAAPDRSSSRSEKRPARDDLNVVAAKKTKPAQSVSERQKVPVHAELKSCGEADLTLFSKNDGPTKDLAEHAGPALKA